MYTRIKAKKMKKDANKKQHIEYYTSLRKRSWKLCTYDIYIFYYRFWRSSKPLPCPPHLLHAQYLTFLAIVTIYIYIYLPLLIFSAVLFAHFNLRYVFYCWGVNTLYDQTALNEKFCNVWDDFTWILSSSWIATVRSRDELLLKCKTFFCQDFPRVVLRFFFLPWNLWHQHICIFTSENYSKCKANFNMILNETTEVSHCWTETL